MWTLTRAKKIFSPDEAKLVGQLSGPTEHADVIAKRAGLSAQETQDKMTRMAKRGARALEKGKEEVGIATYSCGNLEHDFGVLEVIWKRAFVQNP